MKPSSSRPVNSSLFAFQKEMTLVSYSPKKNKSVILINTMHHDATIDEYHPKTKPKIIQFYNKTKGGVDIMNQKV